MFTKMFESKFGKVNLEGESLKEKYADYFKIGVAFSPYVLGVYGDFICKHFNSITCENQMKYSSLNPEKDQYDFKPADTIVNFANRNNIAMHGHTFVWHNQVPDYIFKEATKESLLSNLREHVVKVKEHYGELPTFDAVNEAIEDKTDSYLRDTKWLNILGENYISEVFKLIKDIMPGTELYYNDYNECFPEKRPKIIRMLKEALADGAPISGMGLQSHYNLFWTEFDEIKRSIEEYAALGLKLRISELDVSLYKEKEDPELKWPNPEYEKRLADYYGKVFEIYREYHEHIDCVTFWGVSDMDSWLNGFPTRGRRNHPLLFDDKGDPKEAFYKVMDF